MYCSYLAFGSTVTVLMSASGLLYTNLAPALGLVLISFWYSASFSSLAPANIHSSSGPAYFSKISGMIFSMRAFISRKLILVSLLTVSCVSNTWRTPVPYGEKFVGFQQKCTIFSGEKVVFTSPYV